MSQAPFQTKRSIEATNSSPSRLRVPRTHRMTPRGRRHRHCVPLEAANQGSRAAIISELNYRINYIMNNIFSGTMIIKYDTLTSIIIVELFFVVDGTRISHYDVMSWWNANIMQNHPWPWWNQAMPGAAFLVLYKLVHPVFFCFCSKKMPKIAMGKAVRTMIHQWWVLRILCELAGGYIWEEWKGKGT